jgi:kynurenine formamidase
MSEALPRWKRRPEGSTWGDFGADDQLGRLNLITPEKVRQGVAEVREGLTFCLSLPLDYPGGNVLNPRRHPPVLRPTVRNKRPLMNYRLRFEDENLTDVISDDAAILHLQYSTQWDSLAHVGSLFDADDDGIPEAVYYNGYRADEHVVGPTDPGDAGAINMLEAKSTSQARALGVENMAAKCVQGRAVMIDLAAHVGRQRTLIGYDDLMRIMDKDAVEVETGDMVCLRTGFDEVLLEMNRTPDPDVAHNCCAGLDGRDRRLLDWITASGLSALIADNYAVEAFPAKPHVGCCAALPLHEHCLFKLGVNLGEMWLLSPLAGWLRAHKRYRFLLTAPPLRLPGAVGSPATPVATV